ncbi:Fic family protein [Thauera sinica]|uniref:Fic family protein n=1 Tax=Thauera sinica TaxID=2665146 RepID=A0ABW1APF0_9RHOO|nr:Fic family protein [Thauera sp. K11]ATE59444.1 cell filamentation protein Fic [Thauera sp. K11]
MNQPPRLLAAYTEPRQFEPLIPQRELESLRARGASIAAQSHALTGRLHPVTMTQLRELLRAMNSYYSNRIEGQSTHPRDIARALRREFSSAPDVARRQRIAVAHIAAERELEALVPAGLEALSSACARKAHELLYAKLTPEDRMTDDGHVVEPGEFRADDVAVGRHQPPAHTAIGAFLSRFDKAYGKAGSWESRLFIIGAAHQRFAWIHPFRDGNGRAARLMTHAALFPLTGGLWSVARAMARRVDDYYAGLDAADAPRQGDLDGRGNLSEKALRAWCSLFLDFCEDQVSFMTKMLDLPDIKQRIDTLLTVQSQQDRQIRREATLPLHYLFLAGELTRGEFAQMTGLAERTARSLMARLLETGLLESSSPKGPVRIGFPLDVLHLLMPRLYPEAASES